jgi:signal transduction histidine kinase/CheY-like chemotaxis protein
VAQELKSMASTDAAQWAAQPAAAKRFVVLVTVAGAIALGGSLPLSFPRSALFLVLLAASCVTSAWKINLPIPLASGSTLSVSYAADLMALVLLGPKSALVIAVAGAWTQCTYRVRKRYPIYRTAFSAASEALTMAATGAVYLRLGGPLGALDFTTLAGPLVGAIATYFVINTGLVAGAIALSTGRTWWDVWCHDFLWSGASFMVAGTAGALAAVIVDRGQHWLALLLVAPVYLTYRTYQIFVGRLEDERRHLADVRRLHLETVNALSQARVAERALAEEKERLAQTLGEMTRLEAMSHQLLEREQAARASAEQANRLKDQFLAMVSHELRTPLNAVLGWADMLRSGHVAEQRRDRAFQAIYDGAKRQSQLIDDLLDVARIMSGKLRLSRRAVDMNAIVRDATELLQPAADVKKIQLSIDADPSVPPIHGDASRLQQIVWNLLSNALKFTPEEGAVHVRVRRADGAVEFAVTDTGQGIPVDFLQSVFEPFRQADASSTRAHGGLGLGLSIVRHLVEAHGGTVSAESGGAKRGATFTVWLPVRAVTNDTVGPLEVGYHTDPDDRDPIGAASSLAGISVLVVDDDSASREVIAAYLETRQARVTMAHSTESALQQLARERIDVLIADIAMPGEDGYSLVRRLRALPGSVASVPAIALTAFARTEDRQQSLKAGFHLHLAKPIDAHALVSAVASLGRLNPT